MDGSQPCATFVPAIQYKKKAKKCRKKYVKDEWYVCYYKGGDENGPKRLAMKVGGKPFKRSINDSFIVLWIGIGILAFPVVILILYCSADEIEETHLDEQDKPRERMAILIHGCKCGKESWDECLWDCCCRDEFSTEPMKVDPV